MTMTINATTLCICRHILNSHPNEEACTIADCKCQRFQAGSRRSSSHYRRGQTTSSRRVVRVEIGDRILVGYPGFDEYLRGADGALVWQQNAGELTSYPATTHVDDLVLRPVASKTRALVAQVTGREVVPLTASDGNHAVPSLYLLATSLGDLPPLPGSTSVLVVAR